MASIANDNGGRRRIQFVSSDGTRKAVRLGKVSRAVGGPRAQLDASRVKAENDTLISLR